MMQSCCGTLRASNSNPQTCFRARTPENSACAGIFRRQSIAFDMPDRKIQAILSAEAWTGLAGTLS
jgi:hypothetical protein